jgi:hypothetical protein
MPDTGTRVPAAQILRQTAIQEEASELGRNEYRENSSEYSATTVPVEIDGSGTERVKQSVINMYTQDNEYKNPDATP